MTERKPYHIVHLSAAQYVPEDSSHPTYLIWQNLQAGFSGYHILARSSKKPAHVKDGNLELHLIRSLRKREFEVLVSQALFIPIALRIKPDAIITQHPVLGGIAGAIASRLLKVPLMVELHGVELSRKRAGGLKERFNRWVARRIYRYAAVIRVLSPRMRNELIQIAPDIPPERIQVLPPRVDLEVFRAKTDWSSNGKLCVVMVGAIVENKGQLRAIRTLGKSKIPLRLWIIGDGPDTALCKLEASKFTDTLDVSLWGRLPPQKVADCLRRADVFLMNSLHEGTPRAIMEAMAMGLPVVSTDAGYCADIVDHGSTGFIIPTLNDNGELERHLEGLIHDVDLRCRLGKAGMTRAKHDFEAKKNFERYRAMISGMIENVEP